MSADFRTWHQVYKRVVKRIEEARVEGDKKRHGRYYKIKGDAAKEDVVKGAVAHLLKPESVLPYGLRRRVKLRTVGNISYRRVEPDAWGAWLLVYERHILGGSFWYENDPAIDNLIDLAVDGSRVDVCSATADVGGPKGGKLDHQLSELVSRMTGASQTFRDGAQQEALSAARLGAEQAADEELEQIEFEENEKFRRAINAAPWARKLLKKPAKLDALNMILFEPTLRGRDIAASCGLAESTVSKLRAKVEELADKILLIPEERARPVPDEEVREFYDTHKGQIEQPYEAVAENIREYLSHRPSTPDVALDVVQDAPPDAVFDDELEPFGSAEVNLKDTRDGHLAGDIAPLNVGALSLSPAQGDDYSESVMSGHARTRAAERAQHGGPGRPTIKDAAMGRGYENLKEKHKHRVCALRVSAVKRVKSNRRYTNTAARFLQRQARESGFPIDDALRVIDERIAQKYMELKRAGEELDALISVRRSEVLWLWNENLSELYWIFEFCGKRRYSPDELLGSKTLVTDASLASCIVVPKVEDK